ncbi:hypothetical protein LG314_05290 [Agrococcus terreus]|uniref:hypothetical protein n=1 Tax=Agrococcus terreus TaxID=574649 RepID=UPI003850A162
MSDPRAEGSVAETDAAEPADPRRWPFAARVVRVVGVGLLLAPVVFDEGWPAGLLREEALGAVTIVLGDWVPNIREVAFVCFLLGLLAVLVAPTLGPWTGRGASVVAVRIISPVLLGCTVLAAASAYLGIWLSQESYRVLEPTSGAGCRVVMSGASGGFHGSYRSYGIVRPGEAQVEWMVRSVYADRGDHDTRLSWSAEVARLLPEPGRPPHPELASVRFDCRP